MYPEIDEEDEGEEENAEEEGEQEEFEEEDVQEEGERFNPVAHIPNEQFHNCKILFEELDVHKKGAVPTKTIGFVLRLLGYNPTKSEIKLHMKEVDPDNVGHIGFLPFLIPIARRVNQRPETHEEIIAAFQVLDEEQNGYLEMDKLLECLTTHGEDLEDFEMETLVKAADPKGTGHVAYVEFVEKMMGINRKKGKKKDKKKKKKQK